MKPLLTVFLSILLLNISSCVFRGKRIKGNGKFETEMRSVSNANNIRVKGSIDVELITGATGVKVEADENIIPYVITEMNDGWLVVKFKDNINVISNNNIKVYVTTPAVDKLRVDGSGKITSSALISSENPITLSITGSGDISMDVHVPKVNAKLSGSGGLHLMGQTKDVDVSITGSGNFRGYELKSENTEVSVTGSGDAEVFADEHLKAKITGSGKVSYKGRAEVEKKITGSGEINKID